MAKRRTTYEREGRPPSCVVCSQRASGYNYGAPSCPSCKTFFRRSVILENVPVECQKFGSCSRNECIRPCRFCRFDRCLRGGMNPLLIADRPAGIVQRSNGTAENKRGLPSNDDWEMVGGSDEGEEANNNESDSSTKPIRYIGVNAHVSSQRRERDEILLNPLRIECKMWKIMQNLMVIENAHHKLRISTYSPKLVPGLSLDEFVTGPSKIGGKFEVMYAQSYEPVSIRLVPEEVFIKQRMCIDFSDFDYTSRKLWMFQDVVYAIEFIKALPYISQLDFKSKRVLLASAITTSNFTSAFFSYSQNSDRTCFPDGSVMSWSKDIQEQSPDSTRFHTKIISAMREVQLDRHEYALLKMILVCNPMLDGLTPNDIDLLQREKELFTNALLSYVLARRGVKEGPALFSRILSIVDVVTRLTSWQKSQHILMLAMGLHKHHIPFAESIFHSH